MPKLTERSFEKGAQQAGIAGVQPVVRSTLRSSVYSHGNRRRAQELVWQWVGTKWPRLLPHGSAVGSGHLARSVPGQQLVVSTSGDGSVWTLAVAHSERGGSRTWVTRAQVADAGDTDLLDLQTCCSEPPQVVPVVAPPSLLGAWVERLALEDAGVAVLSTAREVADPTQLAAFCQHVLSDQRTLPIIALASRPNSRYYGVDPDVLARAVRGLAHVACVGPNVSAEVSERLGPGFGVVAGAARIYAPGFGPMDAAQDHPLVRPAQSAGSEGSPDPGGFRRLLCRKVCALSVSERHPGGVPSWL